MHTAGIAAANDAAVSLCDIPVAVLRWPEENQRDAALARQRHLRLLLVAPDAAPPRAWDSLSDWIRLPATDEDI